jgi:carboxymethylenebutenolidase
MILYPGGAIACMKKKQFNPLQTPDGSVIDVWVTWPEEKAKYPAILLFDEGYGINAHIRSVAERLSREGYVVFIPDVYHRLGRQLQLSYGDIAAVHDHARSIDIEDLTLDLKTILSAMESFVYVDHTNIGTLGFSHGGRYSLLANSKFSLMAGVSYYGIHMDDLALANVGRTSPHLFFWGAQDSGVAPETIGRFQQNLRESGWDFTSVVISYAGGGFFCDEQSSYHPLAARQAWGHTLSFLDYLLK